MRKEVYQALKKRLSQLITDEAGNITFISEERLQAIIESGDTPNCVIKHITLWNRQVEFIAEESIFAMPAVFIEFGKISWRTQTNGLQDADLTIGLHVLTNAVPEGFDGDTFHLDLLDKINRCLYGFSIDCLGSLERTASIPCHDHEDILDNTEVFKCLVHDNSAVKKMMKLPTMPDVTVY